MPDAFEIGPRLLEKEGELGVLHGPLPFPSDRVVVAPTVIADGGGTADMGAVYGAVLQGSGPVSFTATGASETESNNEPEPPEKMIRASG